MILKLTRAQEKRILELTLEWHNSDSPSSLSEYLGMTKEQYACYVECRYEINE